jgi:hypothetical protein
MPISRTDPFRLTRLDPFTFTFTVTEEEVQEEGYLKSLSPAEELAVFLSIRGMCLREAGRRAEAAESFAAASRLVPGCRGCRLMLASLGSPGVVALPANGPGNGPVQPLSVQPGR